MRLYLRSAKWIAHSAIVAAVMPAGIERLHSIQLSADKESVLRADHQFRTWFDTARAVVRDHVHEGSLTLELDAAFDRGTTRALWDYTIGPDEHTRAEPTRRMVVEMGRRVLLAFATILRAIEDAPEESEIARDLDRLQSQGELQELLLCVQRTLQDVRAEQTQQLKKHGELLQYIHGHSDYVFQLLASEQLKPALRQFIEKFGPRGVDLAVKTAVGVAL
jgi:hypothetical protein